MENKTPATRAEILRAAAETFGTQPEYLWQDTPSDAVLRHTDGRRWYAVLMTVPRARLGLPGAGSAAQPSHSQPSACQAGLAAAAPSNSASGSLHKSSVALARYNRRGATSASSMCWSTGSRSAWPL